MKKITRRVAKVSAMVGVSVALLGGTYDGAHQVGAKLFGPPAAGQVSYQLRPGRFAQNLRAAHHRACDGAGAFVPAARLGGSQDVVGVREIG